MHYVEKASRLLQVVARDATASLRQPEIKEHSRNCSEALKKIEEYLEKPQLDLVTLNQVHEHTRKFFLFSLILEAQSEAIKRHKSFSSIGESRLQLASSGFNSFLQGNNEAFHLDWLQRIASLLRKEMCLPPVPSEQIAAKEFENFPGFNRGVWKCCGQRHVYCKRTIMRDGEDVALGSEGCSQCTIVEESG